MSEITNEGQVAKKTWRRWIVGLPILLVVIGGLLVSFGPGLLVRHPTLVLSLRSLVDPIEETQEVVWARGLSVLNIHPRPVKS